MNIAWRTLGLPLILFGLVLASASTPRATSTASAASAPAAPAQEGCPIGGCMVLLPAVTVPAIAPILLEPANQEQVDSIAPSLVWTPAITGTEYMLELATTPDFTTDSLVLTDTESFKQPVQEIQSYVMRNNLDGSTTYYWRVSVELPEGISYSPVTQFTTAPEDASRLPGTSQLLAPGDNVRLSTRTPTLVWATAPGDIAYRARLFDTNGKVVQTSGLIIAPKDSYTVRELEPQMVYYWRVRVHNGYGWGDYSPVPGRRFRTP